MVLGEAVWVHLKRVQKREIARREMQSLITPLKATEFLLFTSSTYLGQEKPVWMVSAKREGAVASMCLWGLGVYVYQDLSRPTHRG